jgi:saccharopine dehydrogenase (NAD+, L-lysine-forming)
MMTACIRSGVHYLDIAGEWPVFLEAAARSPAAAAAGVMVMPGVGFTLVASDCLMALAVARTPDTEKLRVGLSRPLVMTRGTVRTSGGMFNPSVFVRRGGALCAVPAGELLHDFDFGQGLTGATAVSMPDVVTGQVTTGVADIEFYAQANWASRLAYRWCAKTAPWTDRRAWELMSRAVSLGWPEAPSAEALQSAGYVLVVEAVDRWRRSTRLRMRTMDGYSVTVLTAGEIVRRVLSGSWAAGFQTPAGLFGGDLILGLGCAVLE